MRQIKTDMKQINLNTFNLCDYYDVNSFIFISEKEEEDLSRILERQGNEFLYYLSDLFEKIFFKTPVSHYDFRLFHDFRLFRHHDCDLDIFRNPKIKFSNAIKKQKLLGKKIKKKELISELVDIELYINDNESYSWIKKTVTKEKCAISENASSTISFNLLSDVLDTNLKDMLMKYVRHVRRSSYGGAVVLGDYCFKTNTITLYLKSLLQTNNLKIENEIFSVLFHEIFHAYHMTLAYLLKEPFHDDYEDAIVYETLASYAEYEFDRSQFDHSFSYRISSLWDYMEIDYWPYAGAKIISKASIPMNYFSHLLRMSILDKKEAAHEIYHLSKFIENELKISPFSFNWNEDFIIEGNKLVKYLGFEETIIIPDCIEIIGEYAFSYCDGLKSVVIPNGVKEIEDYAFRYCKQISEVTLPSTICHIGWCAFPDGTQIFNLGNNHIVFDSAEISCNKYKADFFRK